jgi:hypothetical protein
VHLTNRWENFCWTMQMRERLMILFGPFSLFCRKHIPRLRIWPSGIERALIEMITYPAPLSAEVHSSSQSTHKSVHAITQRGQDAILS